MEELSRCSTCPFCDVPLRTNDSIQHIGTIHSYVENFLPAEHHVKKLPPGGNKRRSVENKRQNKSDEKEASEKIGKEDEEQFEDDNTNNDTFDDEEVEGEEEGEDDDEDEALEPQVASEALEDVFPSQRRKGNPRKGVKEEKTLSCKLCNYAVARAYSPNALHQARLVFLNYLSLFFYSEQSHNHFQWAGMQAKVSLQMWGKLSRR